MLWEKFFPPVRGGFSTWFVKITGCFKAGKGHSASPRGIPAFQHPVILTHQVEKPPLTGEKNFLTPNIENYTNKIPFLHWFWKTSVENLFSTLILENKFSHFCFPHTFSNFPYKNQWRKLFALWTNCSQHDGKCLENVENYYS